MRLAVQEESAGMPGNSSITPSPPLAASKPNWFMRFLLYEKYTDGSFVSLKTDVFAGITLAVAQVAPSVAFAIMGHGEPLVGLFSSFFLGLIACVLGGRPGQITAIAGAVVVLYPDLVDEHGFGAACATSIFAGCFIFLIGVFRVASLVRLLPASLMMGFCNGLALSMVIHQIPQFRDQHGNYVVGMQAFHTAVICVVSYAIMMLLPYFTTVVPSAFIAIAAGTVLEYVFSMNTVTIGDLYELHGQFPRPRVPSMDWGNSKCIKDVMVASLLTAIISAIESFMAGYRIQQITETATNFEREALALGVAHFTNGFFDGMAGCVVYGPCILNIECGSGTRRLSALICAVLMVIIPVGLYAVIGIIPMGALSAVLFGVSSKTADWRMLSMIFLQRISLQESAVALIVTVVTVVENLAIGAASGFAAALVFFMWNMARGRVSMVPVMNSAPYSMAVAEPDDGSTERRRSSAGETLPSALPRSTSPDSDDDERKQQRGAAGGGNGGNGSRVGFAVVDADTAVRRGVGLDEVALHVRKRVTAAASAGVGSPTKVHPVSPPFPGDGGAESMSHNPTAMDVDFLDVRRDPDFTEIKVLRIKLSGVLFFGSCLEFVDGMMKLLHNHHGEIFLKVTDLILDFQHGLLPIMDYSAAEAIEDVAKIFYKRGICTHVQNLDPLSWTCFERCRRYFPAVSEDDVNNVKHLCYIRRIFKIKSRRLGTTVHAANRVDGAFISTDDSGDTNDGIFVRANESLVRTTTITMGPTAIPEGDIPSGSDADSDAHGYSNPEDEPLPSPLPVDVNGDPTGPPPRTAMEHEDAVGAVMSATEEQVPLAASVKVGFQVYRPAFGITVLVFDTLTNWARRERDALAAGAVPPLELGLSERRPLDRQFCEFSRIWWDRLFNRDVPRPVPPGARPAAVGPAAYSAPRPRPPPAHLRQVPRFPGQGFARGECLRRREWQLIRAAVHRSVFDAPPPPELNRFAARVTKFKVDLVDGFI